MTATLPFLDRVAAGRCLAERLGHLRARHPVVLGIPRGGVPVAAEVASVLGSRLDVSVTRKLGAPQSPELAIGAVSADGGRFLNDDILRALNVSPEYLEATVVTARGGALAGQRVVRGRERECFRRALSARAVPEGAKR